MENQLSQVNLQLDINKNVLKRYDKEITELKDMVDGAFNQVVMMIPELKRLPSESP